MRGLRESGLGLLLAIMAGPAAAGSFIVVGVDRTAEFDAMTAPALRLAESLVWNAAAGDTVVVRWISHRSYAADQTLVHMALPAPAALPEVRNRFDARGRRQRQAAAQAQDQALLRAKAAALRTLRAQCVGPTPATDIVGFVQAAAEVFSRDAAPEQARRLVLFTDLEDNRGFRVTPQLDGVAVEVQLLGQQSDPERASRRRARWRDWLEARGAVSVRFLRPALPADAAEASACSS